MPAIVLVGLAPPDPRLRRIPILILILTLRLVRIAHTFLLLLLWLLVVSPTRRLLLAITGVPSSAVLDTRIMPLIDCLATHLLLCTIRIIGRIGSILPSPCRLGGVEALIASRGIGRRAPRDQSAVSTHRAQIPGRCHVGLESTAFKAGSGIVFVETSSSAAMDATTTAEIAETCRDEAAEFVEGGAHARHAGDVGELREGVETATAAATAAAALMVLRLWLVMMLTAVAWEAGTHARDGVR